MINILCDYAVEIFSPSIFATEIFKRVSGIFSRSEHQHDCLWVMWSMICHLYSRVSVLHDIYYILLYYYCMGILLLLLLFLVHNLHFLEAICKIFIFIAWIAYEVIKKFCRFKNFLIQIGWHCEFLENIWIYLWLLLLLFVSITWNLRPKQNHPHFKEIKYDGGE
jgi:hypothetical protein